jgi:hypothetical protein
VDWFVRFSLIVLISMSATQAKAQGIVLFANQPLPGILGGPDRFVRDVGGTPLSGTNFAVELLYQDKTSTWVAHPLLAHFFDRSSSTFVGLWNGGNRTLINGGGVPNPMDPTRALPVNMQVRVWDGGPIGGLTFDEAVAAGMKWGTSDVFAYIEEYDLPSGTDDNWMKNFEGFTLVPEPNAWALFALGTGWLVWRRRKC